jgi:hypothetical protein
LAFEDDLQHSLHAAIVKLADRRVLVHGPQHLHRSTGEEQLLIRDRAVQRVDKAFTAMDGQSKLSRSFFLGGCKGASLG